MKHLILTLAVVFALNSIPVTSFADDDDSPSFGAAGILSNSNRETLPKLTLGSGKRLSEAPLTLRSGGYYVLEIECDGSAELALDGPGFFRAIWVDEVIINDLEVRPFGLESFEFDDEGTIEIKFVAIKPGQFHLKIPGSSGESQRVDITIQ